MKPVYIYLDDERQTPVNEQYTVIRTYTPSQTIEAIKANDGNIAILSLDNDLGLGLNEGYLVADWLEAAAFNGEIKPIETLVAHTSNLARRLHIEAAFKNCKRYWNK